MKITCIGSGAFSLAIVNLLKTKKENQIYVWSHDEKWVQTTIKKKKITMDDIEIPLEENIHLTSNYEEALTETDLVFVLVSSKFFVDVINELVYHPLKKTPIYIGTKGMLDIAPYFLTTYAKKALKNKHINYIAGPNLAKDLLQNSPCILSVTSRKKKDFEQVKDLFPEFVTIEKIEEPNILEISSVLKNIYAIGAGILYEKYPYASTLLSYSAESYKELANLLYQKFDYEDTEMCTGITGDFFLTTSMLESRNFVYGRKRCISVNEGSKYLKKNTVEGYENIDNMVLYLDNNLKKYPILEAIYLILYKNENVDILWNTCFKK